MATCAARRRLDRRPYGAVIRDGAMLGRGGRGLEIRFATYAFA